MNTTISALERQQREDAFRSARGNIGLSGFELSEIGEISMRRLIEGDIDINEYVFLIKSHYSDSNGGFEHLTAEQYKTLEADLTCARIYELILFPI